MINVLSSQCALNSDCLGVVFLTYLYLLDICSSAISLILRKHSILRPSNQGALTSVGLLTTARWMSWPCCLCGSKCHFSARGGMWPSICIVTFSWSYWMRVLLASLWRSWISGNSFLRLCNHIFFFCSRSIITAQFLSYHDIKTGTVVKVRTQACM